MLTASKIKVRDSHEFHELVRISEKNYQNNSCKFVQFVAKNSIQIQNGQLN